MKNASSQSAFTLKEVIAVTAVLAVGFAVFAVYRSRKVHDSRRYACVNHLKQVGLATRLYANDNQDSYPWQVAVTNGGTREFATDGHSAWRHFLVMSNELSTPRILACPADSRTRAAEWHTLQNDRVSYFVGLNADETRPITILSGDRHVTVKGVPANSGALRVTARDPVGPSASAHRIKGSRRNLIGVIGFADGSAQQLSESSMPRAFRAAAEEYGPTNTYLLP